MRPFILLLTLAVMILAVMTFSGCDLFNYLKYGDRPPGTPNPMFNNVKEPNANTNR